MLVGVCVHRDAEMADIALVAVPNVHQYCTAHLCCLCLCLALRRLTLHICRLRFVPLHLTKQASLYKHFMPLRMRREKKDEWSR